MRAEPGHRTLEPLKRFGRAHRQQLGRGLLATLAVVLFRLAIPWPLRGVLEVAAPGASSGGETLLHYLPRLGEPLVWLCLTYLLCAVGGGVSELVQRIGMVRFVSRTLRDLRATAFWTAARRFRGVGSAAGEIISRLVADTGRVRNDLTSILVHVTRDGLLFLSIALLFLLWISPTMGLFFLLGGALASAIGLLTSRPLEASARKARRHEGTLAVTIQQTLEHGHLTPIAAADDGEIEDARSARIASLGSVLVHLVLGVTVCVALWIGVREVRAGSLALGELFLFVAYALLVHRRLVNVGRALSRIGKLRASLERLSPLLDAGDAVAEKPSPLHLGLKFDGVSVAPAFGKRPRLDLSVELPAGARVLVLGRPGDGKSTFLRCLAGAELPSAGALHWDGNTRAAHDGTLAASVGYLPQDAAFAPAPVWRILGLDGDEALDAAGQKILQRIGAWRFIKRLPKGLAQKLGSATVSQNQARALALAAVLLGQAPLFALDSPCTGLKKRAAARRLDAILSRAAGRTLVIALPELRDASAFDRVLVLRRGRVAFDGTPAEWRAWKAGKRDQGVALCKA